MRFRRIECGGCRHFDNGWAALELALPGLSSLSSAHAAVRSADGLCAVHERYVAASSICDSHAGTAMSVLTSPEHG
jgi:hypothetical protein